MRHDPEAPAACPDGLPPSQQPRWRKDFPIDVDQDNYLSRRDFTKFLVLISAAFVAGQAWIGALSLLRRRRGQPGRKEIARLADVPVGGALRFAYPGPEDFCLLLRPDEKTLLAYSQRCTHLSCAVQPDLAARRLLCPCHHGEFDLGDGRPVAGPPRRPLPRIRLEVLDGVVFAVAVEERTT